MPKNIEEVDLPSDCRECDHWENKSVRHRDRVHSVLMSMVDKVEDKVTESEFKATVGDFLKVLEAENEFESANGESREIYVKWKDLPPTLNG